MSSKKHPGFRRVAKKIAKRQNVSLKVADRELAASTRHASMRAKRVNPNLLHIRGKHK